MAKADLRAWLEQLYSRFNDRRFVPPDPLASLYRYEDVRDREIAGLLAAGLAYGNVKAICASVEKLLARLGPSPRKFIEENQPGKFAGLIGNFRHRWTTTDEVANLLAACRAVCARHGSLGAALRAKIGADDSDVHPALTLFCEELFKAKCDRSNSLLADPAKGSACKRTHLFLRWMVRCDAVDPGGWEIPPRLLLMPVDVHIHRIARALRFTRRSAADLQTAREITRGFRRIAPDDPVRFDFALTRLPLHERMDRNELLRVVRERAG